MYFAGGSAVHAMTEALDTGTAPPGAKFEDYFYPEVASLMEAYDGLYWDTNQWLMGGSADKPETCENWLEIGPSIVAQWKTWKDKQVLQHESMRVEWDVTGSLPGCPVPIKGFIDRFLRHDSGQWWILDLKTGKSKPKDRFQLETYAALARPLMGEREDPGLSYYMGRDGRPTPPQKPVQPASEIGERYGKVYAEMVEADKTGDYPAKREFTCKWCPVQDSCLAYSGDTRMAKANDPYYREGRPVY